MRWQVEAGALEQEAAAIAHRLAFACFAYLDDPRLGLRHRPHRVGDIVDRLAAIKRDAGAGEVEMIVRPEKDAAWMPKGLI